MLFYIFIVSIYMLCVQIFSTYDSVASTFQNVRRDKCNILIAYCVKLNVTDVDNLI